MIDLICVFLSLPRLFVVCFFSLFSPLFVIYTYICLVLFWFGPVSCSSCPGPACCSTVWVWTWCDAPPRALACPHKSHVDVRTCVSARFSFSALFCYFCLVRLDGWLVGLLGLLCFLLSCSLASLSFFFQSDCFPLCLSVLALLSMTPSLVFGGRVVVTGVPILRLLKSRCEAAKLRPWKKPRVDANGTLLSSMLGKWSVFYPRNRGRHELLCITEHRTRYLTGFSPGPHPPHHEIHWGLRCHSLHSTTTRTKAKTKTPISSQSHHLCTLSPRCQRGPLFVFCSCFLQFSVGGVFCFLVFAICSLLRSGRSLWTTLVEPVVLKSCEKASSVEWDLCRTELTWLFLCWVCFSRVVSSANQTFNTWFSQNSARWRCGMSSQCQNHRWCSTVVWVPRCNPFSCWCLWEWTR